MRRRPPARKPSFMKILVADFSKKLLIPPKFVRLHRETLARKCRLRPTGTQDSWRVRTKQIENSLYFKKGWREFVRQHSLGFGDLLVFRYAKDCEFYVDMFDKSCCLREPVTSQNVRSQMDTTAILPSQENNANLETPALDAAEELMASSEFPAFNRIMRSAYVRAGGYMPIDPDFEKMYLEDSIRDVKIEVSGKTWTVGVAKDGCSCRLSRCWGYLAEEHGLKGGDVCVFQLINIEDFTLKLTIFSSTKEDENYPTKARSGKTLEAHSVQALKARSSRALEAHSSQAIEADSSQVLEAAFKFSSLSKHPSYPCVMSFSYIRKGNLYVPSTFVKQVNAAGAGGAIKVKLQCWGKEWDAVLSTYGMISLIHKGWFTFAKENSLQIGDACVLELINREDALIRVTIFKCTN